MKAFLHSSFYLIDWSHPRGERARHVLVEPGEYELETVPHPDMDGKEVWMVTGTTLGCAPAWWRQFDDPNVDSYIVLYE